MFLIGLVSGFVLSNILHDINKVLKDKINT